MIPSPGVVVRRRRQPGAPIRSIAVALASSFLLAGNTAAQGRPRVAATIPPLYDIVRSVAGPVADAILILPPGASPHTFEPTPGLARRLAGSALLFMIGHGLDDWAARIAQGVAVSRVVTVDRGIALLTAATGSAGTRDAVDPHYWLSVGNAKVIARTVALELERLVPTRAAEVHASLAAYLVRLDSTDAEVRRILAALPDRRIATFHNAFGYFARAYGLEVVATFEPFPGKEPGPRFVRDFQRTIRETGVRVVFIEPQISTMPLRPIARDLGVSLSMLDPLGGQPGRETYGAMMVFNARQIAAALAARED